MTARDRDLADFGVKVDANRVVINALGEQTAARFDQVFRRFEQVDRRFERLEEEMRSGFAEMRGRFELLEHEMRGKFELTAAGQQRIVDLLTGLIERDGDR
jgi:hypothetical protein